MAIGPYYHSTLLTSSPAPPPPAPSLPAASSISSLSNLIGSLPPSHTASSSSSSFSDRPSSSSLLSGVSFTATPTPSSFPTAHFTSCLLSSGATSTSSPSMPPASSSDKASSSSSKKRKEVEEVDPPGVDNSKRAKQQGYPALCRFISRPDTTDLRFGPGVIPALVTSGSWESITSLPVDQCSVIHTSLPLFYEIWEAHRDNEKTHHLFVNFLSGLFKQVKIFSINLKKEVIEWFAKHPITLSQRPLLAYNNVPLVLEFTREIILINPDLGYKFLIYFLQQEGNNNQLLLKQLTQKEVIEILSRADQINSLPDFFFFAYLVIRRLRSTHPEKASELAVKYLNESNDFYDIYEGEDHEVKSYRKLMKVKQSGINADEEIEEGLSLIELLTAEDREKITNLYCSSHICELDSDSSMHKLIRKFPNIKVLRFRGATADSKNCIELPPNCENLHTLIIFDTYIKFLEIMPQLIDLAVNDWNGWCSHWILPLSMPVLRNFNIYTERKSIKFPPRSCMPQLNKLTINGKRIPVSAIPEDSPSLYHLGKKSFAPISSGLSSSSSSSAPP